MARNTTITAARGVMTELTNSDATSITFQVLSGSGYVIGATDDTPPENISGGLHYKFGQGEMNVPLSEMFPNLSAVRLFIFSDSDAISVAVHHA